MEIYMRLIECYIQGFGKIREQKFEFKDGLNCIKGENGSGKTTLAAFIKAMLFGLGESKKQSTLENDRRHYIPWGESAAKGSLTFSTSGKEYRIERSFGQKPSEDTFTLYDTALGRICEDYTKDIGTELFGIDADGFERTVFLSERQLSPSSSNKSVSAKLANLVGCDGDIGGMDAAMKALEDQRRIYRKKGGAGEISDLEEKISECRARLEALSVKRGEMKIGEARLRTISAEIESLKSESTKLLKEREGAAIKAAKNDYKYKAREYSDKIDECVKEKDKLLDFFRGMPPTYEDIDNASYKITEAKSIIEGEREAASDSEYSALRDRFEGKCDRGEIDKIKSVIRVYSQKEEIKSGYEYRSMKEKFSKRIPEKNEIDTIIYRLSADDAKKSTPASLALILIGSALGLGGAILAFATNILFIIAALVGVITLSLGCYLGAHAKKIKRTEAERMIADLFSSINDATPPSIETAITVLKEYTSLIGRAKELFESADSEREASEIRSFLERFPGEGRDTSDAERIIEGYERYSTAKIAENYIKGERDAKLARAARYKSEAESFIKRFKVTSGDPLTEIRNMLMDYERISQEIISNRRAFTNLTNLHNLGESEENEDEAALRELDKKIRKCDEKIASFTREYAVVERQCRDYLEELDSEDEIRIKLGAIDEERAKKEENYETLLLTKKYMLLAKDNMTSKYLGKTKASFEKYTETIGGRHDDEFEMSTDFEIAKIEGASTHPSEAYSRGTRDLYDIALRFALIDSLYENETPFVILDDPFTALDDTRLRSALKLISSLGKSKQIIYLTCQSARAV